MTGDKFLQNTGNIYKNIQCKNPGDHSLTIHIHEIFKLHVNDKCLKTVLEKYLGLVKIQDAGHVVRVSKEKVTGVLGFRLC
jgi:hypothetical protein